MFDQTLTMQAGRAYEAALQQSVPRLARRRRANARSSREPSQARTQIGGDGRVLAYRGLSRHAIPDGQSWAYVRCDVRGW